MDTSIAMERGSFSKHASGTSTPHGGDAPHVATIRRAPYRGRCPAFSLLRDHSFFPARCLCSAHQSLVSSADGPFRPSLFCNCNCRRARDKGVSSLLFSELHLARIQRVSPPLSRTHLAHRTPFTLPSCWHRNFRYTLLPREALYQLLPSFFQAQGRFP